MTWTWSKDPASSDLDEIRYLVQDTDEDDKLLSDEEIQFEIDRWKGVYNSNVYAAAEVAERIAAKFAREVSISADGVSHGVNELQGKYEALALKLREQHKDMVGAGVYSGGISAWEIWYQDPTIRPLSFGKGMHDNLRAGPQNYPGQIPEHPELY